MKFFNFNRLKNLFKIKPSSITKIADASGDVVRTVSKYSTQSGARILSWANAAKVAVSGAVVYYIFNGGLVAATSDALNIPEWMSSVLWYVIVFVAIVLFLRFLLSYFRNRSARVFKPRYNNNSGNYKKYKNSRRYRK